MPEALDTGILVRGAFLETMCNIVGLAVAADWMVTGQPLVFQGFGITQFIWLIPLWYVFRRKEKSEDAKGVLIVSGITVLLCAVCWGVAMNGRRG
jgi:hypothetical protein